MTDSTSAGSSKTRVSDGDLATLIKGFEGLLALRDTEDDNILAALRELRDRRSDETGACRAPTKAHISEMTVRRLDAGYVVTWREDGESCGSETISEKLAYTLVRNSEGISGINDETTDLKAAAPRDPLLDGLCDHGLRIEDCERGCKKAYDMLPSEADNPTHQHAAGCPKLWGYECECTPEPLSTPSNGGPAHGD